MTTYIAYTRVSTARQSDSSTSLTEQRHAIERYAEAHALPISSWHQEVDTAGTRGRPVFRRVMQQLGPSTGLIIHKIDRGARNLKDWADLGELIDQGIDVRFAHEQLDLGSRGGRLAADIQAVVAADFIRNLRQEVRKGIDGRLREGFCPMQAPLGYLNRGGGKLKEPDPFVAPLITYAFVRYASGEETLRSLAEKLEVRGLRSRYGNVVSLGTLSALLRNPFFTGEVWVRGSQHSGRHQPLVSREIFDAVQGVLRAKRPGPSRRQVQHFLYRGRLQCGTCSRRLTGERQRSYIYYRCHRCRGTSVTEHSVREAIVAAEARVPGAQFGAVVTGKAISPIWIEPVRISSGVR